FEHSVRRAEWTIDRPGEKAAKDSENSERRAVPCGDQSKVLAGRFRWKVGRLAERRVFVHDADDLLLLVDVVAHGEGIASRAAQTPVEVRCQPETAGCVFRIGQDRIEPFAFAQPRQRADDDLHAGLPDNVADKQDAHGIAPRVATSLWQML